MGYYIRFVQSGGEPLRVSDVAAALREVDPAYAVANLGEPPAEAGDLMHGEELLGELEINRPPDPEELAELREEVEDCEGSRRKKQQVLSALKQATAILAVRVLWQAREPEETLSRLQPLWDWLLAHRAGVLVVDDEGFYDRSGLLLEA